MKQENHTVCGKEVTFNKISIGERLKLKFRLLNLFSDIDLAGNKDKETMMVIVETFMKIDPDQAISLLRETISMSVVAPPQLGTDANKGDEKFKSFDEFIGAWEDDENSGEAIIYSLFLQALEVQFGGAIDSLGKKYGFSVKSIKDTFQGGLEST